LFLTRDILMARQAKGITEEQFPDHLDMNGLRLPLSYRFEPGEPDDGVTLTVPLAALNQVNIHRTEWLVPGMLQERMAALLTSLPKPLRTHFVPVPTYASVCMEALTPGDQSLLYAMAGHLFKVTGVQIPPEAWNPQAVPDHLRMNFRVIDPAGKVVAGGRDLEAIKRQLSDRAQESSCTFAWSSRRESPFAPPEYFCLMSSIRGVSAYDTPPRTVYASSDTTSSMSRNTSATARLGSGNRKSVPRSGSVSSPSRIAR
jgi:ATP-dependent helicase HrpA